MQTLANNGCPDKVQTYRQLFTEHLGSFLKSICDQKAEHKCDALPALPADTAETADKGTILRNLVEIFEHVKD